MPKVDTDIIKKEFSKYLDMLGVSPKSHKNYRSDLSHFTGWLILRIRSYGSYIENLTEAIPFLNQNIAREYKSYMAENNQPIGSINRRLSTLRHFARFMVATQVINFDFTQGLENISPVQKETPSPKISFDIVNDFKAFLEAEKVSSSTLKNYLSDVRQFLVWLDANKGNFEVQK